MNVELYDTTLRDGAQTQGISFSVSDKIKIAEKLDTLGIHYIEGGWPGANPKDVTFFKKAKRMKFINSKLVAFGSTRRANADVSKDATINGLLRSGVENITIFGKSWDLHVETVLRTALDENLKMIEESVKYLKSKGKFTIFDAEHFFDGYADNPEYALKTLMAAESGGADRIVLCDTNGGTLTAGIFEIVEAVRKKVRAPLGIHAHNDSDTAVANTIAAVQAGCIHVQGTINGYGERCGNANLISIIGNLKLKLGVDCIQDMRLKELTEAAHFIADMSNMKLADNQPFVGNSAFAHKAGVHVNAIIKNPRTYEHVEPSLVGNRRKLLISELSGKSSILKKAGEIDLGLDKDAPKTKKILKALQDLEHKGYHFESAEASLELFMRRAAKGIKKFFDLKDFRVIVEKHSRGKILSEATIKLKVNDKLEHTASLGDGPVNALDNAIRKALMDFYPSLSEMHLTDFKVRVLDEKAGTAAKVRVLIQSQDKTDSWWTIGVSENIIEASWYALVDSVEYKLLKDSKKS
ncbi:MAG: citramalate synthase [Omnitrophica bacterium RBG_13_46_9]|nr:MAG: citramalate synthase [Omnitrophica bacterium RBG_13_46_9]